MFKKLYMPAKHELILISYDIENNKKRKKISDILLDAGGKRVQKSVFECFLTKSEMEKLQDRIHKLKSKNDSVRYYFLCRECLKHTVVDEPENPEAEDQKNVYVV